MVMRQQVWIDQHVQGVLVGRVLLYWSGILIYFGLSIGCFHWWQNPEWTLTEHLWAMFEQVLPCLPTLLLLFAFSDLRHCPFEQSFCRPSLSFAQALDRVEPKFADQSIEFFRDDDYWQHWLSD